MSQNKILFGLWLLLLLFYQCRRNPDEQLYVARVGDRYLMPAELQRLLPSGDDKYLLNKDYVHSVISSWITKEVLYQKSKEYHFDKDESIRYKRDSYFRDLSIDLFLKYFIQTNIRISETEIRDYYLANRSSFLRDFDEAKVTHVMTTDFEEARKIRAALLSHDSKDLNRYFSVYRFETKIVRHGEALRELDKTIFEGPPRSVLGPIATDYGFHVIQVHKTYKKGSFRPIEEVRDEIIQRLSQQKIQENYSQLTDSLLANGDFEFNENNLINFMSHK